MKTTLGMSRRVVPVTGCQTRCTAVVNPGGIWTPDDESGVIAGALADDQAGFNVALSELRQSHAQSAKNRTRSAESHGPNADAKDSTAWRALRVTVTINLVNWVIAWPMPS